MRGERSLLNRMGIPVSTTVDRIDTVAFPDPYRLLEAETAAVQAWASLHDGRTRARVESAANALEPMLARLLAADRRNLPIPFFDSWLWLNRDPDGRVGTLRMSSSLESDDHDVLVSVSQLPVETPASIEGAYPSPDGRLIALTVAVRGDEQLTLIIIDATSRAVLGTPIAAVGSVAWMPDSDRLALALGRRRSQEQPLKRLAFLRVGHLPEWAPHPPQSTHDAGLVVQVSPDGQLVAASAPAWNPRLRAVYEIATNCWREVPCRGEADGILFGAFLGDQYVAVSDDASPHGCLVAAPITLLGEPDAWSVVRAPGEEVLRTIVPFAEGAAVFALCGTSPAVILRSADGSERRLGLPEGTVLTPGAAPGSIGAASMPVAVGETLGALLVSSPGQSPAVWQFTADGDATPVTEPEIRIAGLRLERLEFKGGGTTHRLVRITSADDSRRIRPVLLHGYGGFDNVPVPEAFSSVFAPWVLAGGDYVFAHLSGDGTEGTDRWRAGRREHKTNTFDEFITCAEWLVELGFATASSLAVVGASNGGLLAANVIVQRPDLFRAAAILTPMTDMARIRRERFAEAFSDEYGNADIEEEARWLREWSPYHMALQSAGPHPSTIIVCAENDMRTHPWHSRKLAAALLDADPASAVYLRTHAERGHGDAVWSTARAVGEWLGFLMTEVGLNPEAARLKETQ